ncbi:MAG: lysophospholipase, partial [Desulfovibrionaceae bacterium]|nr:lysophospholipase [Desulfovibrionaceae bacterium]
FVLSAKKIDLKKITMPLLNVYGTKDNLIPASASIPLIDLVGSKDKENVSYPIGHAGIVASTLSQKEIAPKIASWIKDHSKA